MRINCFSDFIKDDFTSLLAAVGLDAELLHRMALDAEWIRRLPRKINALGLFIAVCSEALRGTASYNGIAAAIDAGGGGAPSRQAVARRMNGACLRLFEDILARAIHFRVAPALVPAGSGFLARYSRVLVQDSTIVKLPAWLFDAFSGVSNAHGPVCNGRIQAVYDLRNMDFVSFSIDSYSRNDLAAAPSLEVLPGDLVLRDRGYLTADEIARHVAAGADCIYRHKTGTIYLDPETREPVDLLALLRRDGHLDMTVLLNDAARTPVRLVSAPVDEETAGRRRMKARKETRGHAPSAAVLALMDWTIFITTIARGDADFGRILAVYGLRWRMETIFKAWKSHLNFGAIHRVSEIQLRITLSARLFAITVCASVLHAGCRARLARFHGARLSLLKFLEYLNAHPGQMAAICRSLDGEEHAEAPIWKSLRRYCCHDKRIRRNFDQMYDALA